MKTISEILKTKDSHLTKLINKTKNSQNLELILRMALDLNLKKYCYFANYKKSILTIIVTNISIATRLRYTIPELIKNLRAQPEFKNITKIRYTVAPTLRTEITKSKNKCQKLSPNNKILWQKILTNLKKKQGE